MYGKISEGQISAVSTPIEMRHGFFQHISRSKDKFIILEYIKLSRILSRILYHYMSLYPCVQKYVSSFVNKFVGIPEEHFAK